MKLARYEGVKENADGTFELDIKAQTKAVIEKYDSIPSFFHRIITRDCQLSVLANSLPDLLFLHPTIASM